VIKFENISSYHKYFQKLKKYAQNPSAFVDKKIFVENFVAE
jgi:hypothetical protein